MRLVSFEHLSDDGSSQDLAAVTHDSLGSSSLGIEALSLRGSGALRLGAVLPNGAHAGATVDLNRALAVKLALDLEEQLDPDLMMVLLSGIDRISHSLWGTLHPETAAGLDEDKRLAGARFLMNYYRLSDQLLGRLLERYGPDDLVLVVSDHGFEFTAGKGIHPWGGTHDTERALHGILFARGPGVPVGKPTPEVSVNDIAPTVLAWLGLPVALDMDGRPASFLDRPFAEVASYDSIEIERVGETGSEAEPEILRQLEALGYIDGK